jgi:hypothetical protein
MEFLIEKKIMPTQQSIIIDPNKNELINHLNAELNPICCLQALLGAHHFLHISRIRVK